MIYLIVKCDLISLSATVMVADTFCRIWLLKLWSLDHDGLAAAIENTRARESAALGMPLT